jgi:molybdopterin converting factor small subunit
MPTSILRIPTPLRPYTGGKAEIEVIGDTVAAALESLTDQYPSLQPHLFDREGNLRAFVNLFLNEEDIRHLQGVATPLEEGDRLMLIPSIAGGFAGLR